MKGKGFCAGVGSKVPWAERELRNCGINGWRMCVPCPHCGVWMIAEWHDSNFNAVVVSTSRARRFRWRSAKLAGLRWVARPGSSGRGSLFVAPLRRLT